MRRLPFRGTRAQSFGLGQGLGLTRGGAGALSRRGALILPAPVSVQRRIVATGTRDVPPTAQPQAIDRRWLVTPDPRSRESTLRKGYVEAAAAHGGPDAFPSVRAFEDAPEDVRFFSSVSTAEAVRAICHSRVPGWSELDPSIIEIDQLCEGLSNQNFRVHLGEEPPRGTIPCVLFRIYGKDVETLYDGKLEMRIVETLSRYQIAPKIFASGDGWRIEEWHFSVPLPNRSMRNPSIFVQVAAQLARLHKISTRHDFPEDILSLRPMSFERLDTWANGCTRAAASFTHPGSVQHVKSLDMEAMLAEREWLREYVVADDPKIKGSGLDVVFSHWDSQENNILQTQYGLRLIDFEYAGMEHQAFDIASYFIECTIDYLVDKHPYYKVRLSDYPSEWEQRLFCSIYLSEYFETTVLPDDVSVSVLLERVQRFTLMSHLLWALWSVIRAPQAPTFSSFDYLTYAESRWFMYKWRKRELLQRGGARGLF